MVVIEIKSYYTCEDCKCNYVCSDKEQGKSKCKEFELDRIMSDKYVDRFIERSRKRYAAQWYEENGEEI